KACDYSLSHWGYLSTYLRHGHVAIDNNWMENAIRPTAVGKKNWLCVSRKEVSDVYLKSAV
ncbi:transposase, partial [Pelagicoccus enzymogenes]|uniref:IS66 family transposase n=1 Tax=Pelagicoccus enzymogenes TaxID=2773457 RepID=UPI00280F7FF4